MRLIPMLAGAVLLAPAVQVQAQPAGFTDPARIDAEVARFTGAALGTPGGARLPVDRRLKLGACAVGLELGWYGARRDTVQVRCPLTDGWRIYVPLETGVPAAARQDIAVAKGDAVSITVRGHGFTLSRQGQALEPGAVGQWIRVRPAGGAPNGMGASARTGAAAEPVRARVLRPGAVGMDLP